MIQADVSVVQEDPSLNLGGFSHLIVDGNPLIQTFFRARVTGLGTQRPLAATLRLHVASERGTIFKSTSRAFKLFRGAPSKSAGRIHLVEDCGWQELRMTWEDRPVINTDPLDTQGAVVRGQVVDFDVTEAIVGDGYHCFALDSLSRDGVAYYSREGRGGTPQEPQLLLVSADSPGPVGIVVADASVRETRPNRNFGRSAMLWVDGQSLKRTFFRVRVRGFEAELVRDARLRLLVDDGEPATGPAGRLYEVTDCTWNELTVTYNTQPEIDGPLLDELDEVVSSGDVVEFDITPAIIGDGDYCFALESASRDGVTYRSREAAVGGPVIVTTE